MNRDGYRDQIVTRLHMCDVSASLHIGIRQFLLLKELLQTSPKCKPSAREPVCTCS